MEKKRGKITHASREVNDEEALLKVVLQDLKGSAMSNVKSNIINLRKNKRCTCHRGDAKIDQRSARTTWATRTRIRLCLGSYVRQHCISESSGEGCRQRRMVTRILHNPLKSKMIVREQTLYGVDPTWCQ